MVLHFLFQFLQGLLSVYRNAIDFCISVLCLAALLNSLTSSIS